AYDGTHAVELDSVPLDVVRFVVHSLSIGSHDARTWQLTPKSLGSARRATADFGATACTAALSAERASEPRPISVRRPSLAVATHRSLNESNRTSTLAARSWE